MTTELFADASPSPCSEGLMETTVQRPEKESNIPRPVHEPVLKVNIAVVIPFIIIACAGRCGRI